MRSRGVEGIVSKRAGAAYTSGRGPGWLKVKCIKPQEFVIGGFTDPSGARGHFGALLLGQHDEQGGLRYAGKVGTVPFLKTTGGKGLHIVVPIEPRLHCAEAEVIFRRSYLGLAIDLSRQKQHQRELETLNRLLAERSAKAESANAAKSMFLANMSHEIRTHERPTRWGRAKKNTTRSMETIAGDGSSLDVAVEV